MKKQACLGIVILMLSALLTARETTRLPSTDDTRNDQPVIAFSSDGTLWTAWQSFQGGRFRLSVAVRTDGGWSAVVDPDPSPGDHFQPAWAVGPAGKPVLVYTTVLEAESTVKLVAPSGAGWGEPVPVGSGSGPSAAYDGQNLWTAWENNGRILYRKRGASGFAGPAQELDPGPGLKAGLTPVLAAGPANSVWLAWSAARRDYQAVLLKRLGPDGGPALVVDDGDGINRNPRISVDRRGRVWVVYEKLEFIDKTAGPSPDPDLHPFYEMDERYRVEFPSRTIRVTDGGSWWVPKKPQQPESGLLPAIFCSSSGPVHLISRTFVGHTPPRRYFNPLVEILDSQGWGRFEQVWAQGQSYKVAAAMAEDPSGRVWAAWARHDRKKVGMRETPAWSHLDGTDKLFVAPMPEPAGGGEPELLPLKRSVASARPGSAPAGPRERRITLNGKTLNLYFGDIHQHSEFSGCGRTNGRIEQNQAHTRHVRELDFMCTIDHAEHYNDYTWRVNQLVTDINNRPGEFACFSGFEWTSEFDAGGNLYRGHYNALFRTVGEGDTYFSASDPRYNTPLELWDALRDAVGGPDNVLTFAHHTSRRLAWLTWCYYDPDMAPLIEIAQARGSYEYEGCPGGPWLANDSARVSGHFIRDGLERGMRWGFAAAPDHGGRQLTAVYAPELTRDAIFDGLRSRRTYATYGERMFLDVRVNGRFMGEEFVLDGPDRRIEIETAGTQPLVEVVLFRNGQIVRKWIPGSVEARLEYADSEPLVERETYYYARVVQKGGSMAWSSPTWVINPENPGTFRFQVGGDELHVVYPDREEDFSVLMHNETDAAVTGRVSLSLPEGWTALEKGGVETTCAPGGWAHAVFHVTAPASRIPSPALPEVIARFESGSGLELESRLFVVAYPGYITAAQKAMLIDARRRLPADLFPAYFQKAVEAMQKESK